jgi:single-strand DNA-binding protein
MKSIGLARLGRDAEVRYTPGGDAVCNLSLAYVCGRKKEGDQYPPSQWVDASLWGKQAEALAPYLVKGSVHCFTLADIHIEKYQGQNGEGYKLVARVEGVELGPRSGDAPAGGDERAARPASGGSQPQRRASGDGRAAGQGGDMDDDIPF